MGVIVYAVPLRITDCGNYTITPPPPSHRSTLNPPLSWKTRLYLVLKPKNDAKIILTTSILSYLGVISFAFVILCFLVDKNDVLQPNMSLFVEKCQKNYFERIPENHFFRIWEGNFSKVFKGKVSITPLTDSILDYCTWDKWDDPNLPMFVHSKTQFFRIQCCHSKLSKIWPNIWPKSDLKFKISDQNLTMFWIDLLVFLDIMQKLPKCTLFMALLIILNDQYNNERYIM